MASKTWNGVDGAFITSANWSDGLTPGVGDTALINAGTVSYSGYLPNSLTVDVTGLGSSPKLVLTGAAILSADRIVVNSQGPDTTLEFDGGNVNLGSLTFSGSRPVLALSNTVSGTSFDNRGGLSASGSGFTISSFGSGIFYNDAVMSFHNSGTSPQLDTVFSDIIGTGTVLLNGGVALQQTGAFGAGQTINFQTGANTLLLNSASRFAGTIQGFGAGDDLVGLSNDWSGVNFQASSMGGSLNFTGAGGSAVFSVTLKGNYTSVSNFSITKSISQGGVTQTDIKSGVVKPVQTVNYTDTVNDISASDIGTVYSGPVSYLQYQYLWNSPDSVAISARVNSVFLHGGAGSDALQALGGSNVIDGGGGSNFLVGASGTDGGSDTFFVDERGSQVTWSTLLNFHAGDSVTIFGFRAGVSTLPLSTDGTPGYTGATIHSEIGGSGTGVNGSVTFAGVSLSDFQTKFTQSTGTEPDGTTYLNITRTS